MMANKVKAIPDGYHSVTPYMIVKGAANAIEFYKKAFGATEIMRMQDDKGKIKHAEIKIGNSPIMLADEFPEMKMMGPQSQGGTGMFLHLYVEDVDAIAKQAVAAGAKEIRPVADHFYGDRAGNFLDPYGHQWYISTHVEDLSPDEIRKRAQAIGM